MVAAPSPNPSISASIYVEHLTNRKKKQIKKTHRNIYKYIYISKYEFVPPRNSESQLQPFQPFLQSYIPRVFQNNLLLPRYLLSIAFATSLLLKCHAVIQLNKMDETLTMRKQHSSTVASPLCNSFFGTGIHSGWDYASTYFAPANQSPHKSILTSSLLGVDGTSQDRERGFQLHFAGANEDRLKEAKQ